MKKAVVIFSGGQDSTTCLFWALANFDYVEAITFYYNQNHRVEIKQARFICEKEGVKLILVDVSFYAQLINSSMVTGGDTSAINEKGLPASFVPNRNQLFITIAHAYAQKIGAKTLITGVCQTDYSGYPDCRQQYINAIAAASNLGSDERIEIKTPLMNLTKAETFVFAAKLGRLQDIIDHTHTCYNGDRFTSHEWGKGCGKCPACQLRANGWEDFKGLDPEFVQHHGVTIH